MAIKGARRWPKSRAPIRTTSPKPFSNYSHVVTAEGAQKLGFYAGQVAADVDGKVMPPDDFDAQARMVMKNLDSALAGGGAKLSRCTPRLGSFHLERFTASTAAGRQLGGRSLPPPRRESETPN
jgi:hypothetical protein